MAFPYLLEIRREVLRKADYSEQLMAEKEQDPFKLCCSFLKDLDDEDVPKSDKDLDGNKKVKKSLPLVAGVGIGVAALAALAATIVIVRKRVHR